MTEGQYESGDKREKRKGRCKEGMQSKKVGRKCRRVDTRAGRGMKERALEMKNARQINETKQIIVTGKILEQKRLKGFTQGEPSLHFNPLTPKAVGLNYITVLLTESRTESGGGRRIELEGVHHHLRVWPAVSGEVLQFHAGEAHVLSQVVLVELRLGRSQAQVEVVLDLLHVLLQQHHVVHVFLAGHVNTQVPRHVGLVVTHLPE